MFHVFQHLREQYTYYREFRKGQSLRNSGQKEQAFQHFRSMLNKYPCDIYLGRQVGLLGDELGQAVDLPEPETTPDNLEASKQETLNLHLGIVAILLVVYVVFNSMFNDTIKNIFLSSAALACLYTYHTSMQKIRLEYTMIADGMRNDQSQLIKTILQNDLFTMSCTNLMIETQSKKMIDSLETLAVETLKGRRDASTTASNPDIKSAEGKSLIISKEQPVQVVILCATYLETKDVLAVFKSKGCDTQYVEQQMMSYYSITMINKESRPLNLRLYTCGSIGSISAASYTVQILMTVHPRRLIITGRCAGNANLGVRLGDLIIADSIVNMDLGKVTPDGFIHEARRHDVDDSTIRQVQHVSSTLEKDWFVEALPAIENNSQPIDPHIYIGGIASSVSIRADFDSSKWRDLSQRVGMRRLYGLDMEAAGFYEAVKTYDELRPDSKRVQTLLIKGVCDYGTSVKEDYTRYASQLASLFTYEFLRGLHLKPDSPKTHTEGVIKSAPVDVKTPDS